MLALQVLEILSVCCYYSNDAAISTFKAFQVRGAITKEAPLTFLCTAFIEADDIETKTAIMKFINTMLVALPDNDEVYQDFVTYLQDENFEGHYQDALKLLDSASEKLAGDSASPSNTSNITESNLPDFGDEKADDEASQQEPATPNLNVLDRTSSGRLESRSNEETEAQLKFADHPGAFFITFPSGMRYSQFHNYGCVRMMDRCPKTMTRWFYLDGHSLKTLQIGDNTNEGCLEVADILQIRSKTTEAYFAENNFEIEMYNGSKLPFGCGGPEEQKRWLTAFQIAKARRLISISSYIEHTNESNLQSVNDIVNFSNQFRRQGALYTSIVEENRQSSAEDLGFDYQDIGAVSSYLQKLLLVAGFSGQLLQILQECVLLAPGDKSIWDTILAGIKKLRKQNRFRDSIDDDVTQSEDSFFDSDDAMSPSSYSFADQLNGKFAGGSNSVFTEMSRLALMAMTKEQENKDLKQHILTLKQQVSAAQGNKISGVVVSAVDKLKMSSMQTKANKLEAKVKQLEEYFTSNQSTIAKLEEEVQQQKDNIEKLEFQNKKLQQELEAKKSTVLEKTNSQESRVQGAAESTANLSPSAVTDQSVAPVEDRFKTYRTMKKLLPERAVRQKMQCDGFNEEEIQAFLDERVVCSSASEEKGKGCSDKDSVNMKGQDTVAVPPNLKAALFTSLEGRRAGNGNLLCNPPLVVVLTKPSNKNESPPEGMQEKVISIKPPQKLKTFYWVKIKATEVVGTVFYKLPDFNIPESFVSQLNELYLAKVSVAKASQNVVAEQQLKPNANKLVSVVDSKRVQTLLIVMTKLKLEPEDVMQVIVKLDPEVLTADMIQSIKSILPTPDELTTVKTFTDPNQLDRASRLVYHLNRVPYLVTRLQCHEIPFSWFGFCNSVLMQLRVVQAACDELHKFEESMQNVLAIILSLGNYLNVDTNFGCAYGFKLDTLSKLETFKDVKSGSLLHLVTSIVQDVAGEALTASENLNNASAAASISMKEAIQDIGRLEKDVKTMRGELKKITDDEKNNKPLRGLDGEDETIEGPVTRPFVTRLTDFLVEAEPKLSDLKNQVQFTQEKVSELMRKYGENFDVETKEEDNSSSGTTKFKFFGVITTFFGTLRTARDDNLKRQKAAEKITPKKLEEKENIAAKGRVDITWKKKTGIKGRKEQPGPTSGTTGTTRTGGVSPLRRTLLLNAKSQRSIGAGQQENIFSSFHSDHERTTEAVLTELERHPSKREAVKVMLMSESMDS
eukprot:gene26104-34712_t